MQNEIRDKLISIIDGSSPALTGKVSRYRGEFEKDSSNSDGRPSGRWNPDFPACFVFLKGFNKDIEGTYGETLKKGYSFVIYVADRDDCASLAEEIYNTLDGTQIEAGEDFYNLNVRLVKLLGFMYSVDVYTIELSVK
jgi:hypothetical protein